MMGADFGPHFGADHPVEAFGLKFRSDLGNSAGLDKATVSTAMELSCVYVWSRQHGAPC